MYNVLSIEIKKQLRKEYYIRVFATFLFLISGLAFSGLGVLAPSVIISRQNTKMVDMESQQFKKDQDRITGTKKVNISDLEVKAKILDSTLDKRNMSAVFEAISSVKGKGVSINKFSEQKNGNSTTTLVVVSGVANTRKDLQDFRDVLRRTPPVVGAEFPIDVLGKSKDLQFTMAIYGDF
jgi:hypothetical protein